jgi:hypothetical protein
MAIPTAAEAGAAAAPIARLTAAAAKTKVFIVLLLVKARGYNA